MAARVQQRLREMACVAFLLRNRERAVDLLDAGDHATFRQQAVQFFGPAPANVDPQDYIAELQTAVQTQKSFYVFLSKYCLTVGGVTDLTIRGVSDARRAKQRKNFLFLAKEGADEDFHSFAAYSAAWFGRALTGMVACCHAGRVPLYLDEVVAAYMARLRVAAELSSSPRDSLVTAIRTSSKGGSMRW